MDYSKKTLKELIELCKERGITGYKGMKKEDIAYSLELYDKPEATQPTFIEVCAGCGGLSTGFMNAGFKPLLINEIEKTFCETLRKNHAGENIVQKSMTELDLSEYKGQVDVLQGGVPCQAFSQAGERLGLEDPRGKLIVAFNTLIQQCEPKVFLVENVKGLLTHRDGETLKSVLELFSNNGAYQVQYKLLNAKDYSVPQKRERVFIVGIRVDVALTPFAYPEKHEVPVLLRDVLVNVPDSLGAKYPEHKAEVMRLVPQGGCWVDLPEDVKKKYMGASMDAGGGKRGMARRLAMDEQCLTLTTSPCQKQTERCHPIETRPLSVREYARIQTFPDTYEFAGGMGAQYRQIGNAVPVKLAEAMALQIKNFLFTLPGSQQ
jgi:DNA (cytosine-5)-methyltransferase 1